MSSTSLPPLAPRTDRPSRFRSSLPREMLTLILKNLGKPESYRIGGSIVGASQNRMDVLGDVEPMLELGLHSENEEDIQIGDAEDVEVNGRVVRAPRGVQEWLECQRALAACARVCKAFLVSELKLEPVTHPSFAHPVSDSLFSASLAV